MVKVRGLTTVVRDEKDGVMRFVVPILSTMKLWKG
jgi:hypothetical protein